MALNSVERLNKYLEVANQEKLAQVATDYFRKITPYRKGNARRNTYRQGNEVVANYPYAARLDDGYSNQAPRGMSVPTEEYLQQYIKNQLGK